MSINENNNVASDNNSSNTACDAPFKDNNSIRQKGSLIVSSTALYSLIKYIKVSREGYITLMVKEGRLHIEGVTGVLYVESKTNFIAPLYYSSIINLRKILQLIGDQPFAFQIADSQTFNIKIIEAYI